MPDRELLYLTEKYGRVFPSLEGLAHLAMCCKQSVVTALNDLELLGFVTRIRRLQTPFGFKIVQITNAYRVHEPARGLGLLATVLFGKPTGSNYLTPSVANFYSKRVDDRISPEHRDNRWPREPSLTHAVWGGHIP
jgi:hypothetical protein